LRRIALAERQFVGGTRNDYPARDGTDAALTSGHAIRDETAEFPVEGETLFRRDDFAIHERITNAERGRENAAQTRNDDSRGPPFRKNRARRRFRSERADTGRRNVRGGAGACERSPHGALFGAARNDDDDVVEAERRRSIDVRMVRSVGGRRASRKSRLGGRATNCGR
jgi:hypothetical protein